MLRYLPMLAVAGLLLSGALIAGCASTNYGTGTTAPTTVPTTAGVTTTISTTTAPTTTAMTTTAATTAATTAITTTATTSAGGTASVEITAQNIKFDKSTITVPAGSRVTVTFHNMDAGVPHTFSVYTDSSASTAIFKGQRVTGVATTTYTFTAPSTPGTYYFRCDVHPTQMNGQFVVT